MQVVFTVSKGTLIPTTTVSHRTLQPLTRHMRGREGSSHWAGGAPFCESGELPLKPGEKRKGGEEAMRWNESLWAATMQPASSQQQPTQLLDGGLAQGIWSQGMGSQGMGAQGMGCGTLGGLASMPVIHGAPTMGVGAAPGQAPPGRGGQAPGWCAIQAASHIESACGCAAPTLSTASLPALCFPFAHDPDPRSQPSLAIDPRSW